MLHPMLLEAGLLRVPKILVLLFAFCCCWFLFCCCWFFFFFFSVLVQDLHPTEIGDMYFRFHYNFYIFLASSPPAAPDERGHTHILRSAAEERGGGGRRRRGRKRLENVEKRNAIPRATGSNRHRIPGAGRPCPGPRCWHPRPPVLRPFYRGRGGGGRKAVGSLLFGPVCARVCPQQAGGSSGICIATHADGLLHRSPQRD